MSALLTAMDRLRAGGMVILMDDEGRENEGDLVVAAQFATPDAVNFMATNGRGLICLALEGAQVDRLGLPPMVDKNQARRSTAFTVSIEARDGISTGISAHDRSRTIQVAADPNVLPSEIVSPGHVFPLRAADGGVLARDGHTEGSTDMVRLAGLNPGAVICEVMLDNGQMARRDYLDVFAEEHDLPILTIQDIVDFRLQNEALVDQIGNTVLPTSYSSEPLAAYAFRNRLDGIEHLALVKHPVGRSPLVRVHSECLTGDVLGSLRCDCGSQLQSAIEQIQGDPNGGVVIYLRGHEGRGIGLGNKIKAYALQDKGYDTVEANTKLGFKADQRSYETAAHILRALNITSVRLMSNNPQKVSEMRRLGIEIEERVPLIVPSNLFNHQYLATKGAKFGHVFNADQA